jgi:hypothetical protein
MSRDFCQVTSLYTRGKNFVKLGQSLFIFCFAMFCCKEVIKNIFQKYRAGDNMASETAYAKLCKHLKNNPKNMAGYGSGWVYWFQPFGNPA